MIAIANDALNCFTVIFIGALGPDVKNRIIFQVTFQDNWVCLQASYSHVDMCVMKSGYHEATDMTLESNIPFCG